MIDHTQVETRIKLKSNIEIQSQIGIAEFQSETLYGDLRVTLMYFTTQSSVTLVTLKTTFTTNGATHSELRKVLLKSDCSERIMCYYRDRSGKLNDVPRNGH